MKISETIAALQRVQEERGDLDVEVYAYGDIDSHTNFDVEVQSSRLGPDYALLRV